MRTVTPGRFPWPWCIFAPRPLSWRQSLVRHLQGVRNDHHAHSPRLDVVVFGRRHRPRHCRCVDALGSRASVQTAPQQRSIRIASQHLLDPDGAGQHRHRRAVPKEQGRRRSMTPGDLASPDIEIGSRHPVNSSLAQYSAGECDPAHNRRKKSAAGLGKGRRNFGIT